MRLFEFVRDRMTTMSKQPLTDFFKATVRKMVRSIGQFESGNIYSLLINQVEKSLIEIVLEEQKYNYFHTARVLGIGRSTLYRKMETLQIAPRPRPGDPIITPDAESLAKKIFRAHQQQS
jgi:Fis family transcriptional regulator, factor for inversion stimulation protein